MEGLPRCPEGPFQIVSCLGWGLFAASLVGMQAPRISVQGLLEHSTTH